VVPLGPRADNPPALGPAGTVHIDHLSWTPYLAAHLNLARGEPGPLSDPTFASLHTLPEGGDYAAGWGVREPPEGLTGPMLWHRGSNTMWLSYVALLPAMDVAFICNANVGATNPVTEQCEGLLVKALDALN
jgi:hypothetical protein